MLRSLLLYHTHTHVSMRITMPRLCQTLKCHVLDTSFNPCRICGMQCETGTGIFSQVLHFSSLNIISPMVRTHSLINFGN